MLKTDGLGYHFLSFVNSSSSLYSNWNRLISNTYTVFLLNRSKWMEDIFCIWNCACPSRRNRGIHTLRWQHQTYSPCLWISCLHRKHWSWCNCFWGNVKEIWCMDTDFVEKVHVLSLPIKWKSFSYGNCV